jgi:DNA-binding MarR family transcriptional regulator
MGNDGVAAVEKALSLLDCCKLGAASQTLASLSQASGMHKTTVYRLMNSLERMGYVVRSQAGEYSLGHRVLYLGKLFEQSFQLSAVVEPVLYGLAAETKESASYPCSITASGFACSGQSLPKDFGKRESRARLLNSTTRRSVR